jgi:5-methylcytosine-specific restriction protein A
MAIRSAQLAREPRCRGCGAVATEVDHIARLADGGSDHPRNLQSLCRRCHADKTSGER